MSYDAKAIANYFIDLAQAKHESLSPMKLQKLVYFAHGWYYGLLENPLLNEQVQAWSFGPVIRSLYDEFREFGANPITRKATEVDIEPTDPFAVQTRCPSLDDYAQEDNELTRHLLDRIWEVYGGFSAYQLSNLTHEEGTPWSQVSKKYNGRIPKHTTIPEESIKDYFTPKEDKDERRG